MKTEYEFVSSPVDFLLFKTKNRPCRIYPTGNSSVLTVCEWNTEKKEKRQGWKDQAAPRVLPGCLSHAVSWKPKNQWNTISRPKSWQNSRKLGSDGIIKFDFGCQFHYSSSVGFWSERGNHFQTSVQHFIGFCLVFKKSEHLGHRVNAECFIKKTGALKEEGEQKKWKGT